MTMLRAETAIAVDTNANEADEVARAKASEIAAGLRRFADFIEANPGLWDLFDYPLARMNTPSRRREWVVEAARSGARAAGVTVTKHQDDRWAGVDLTFSPMVVAHVYMSREEICERIVTGTRLVVEEVPDAQALAAVPTVTVERYEDVVEWRCAPLLADDAPSNVDGSA